ncbi:MULTISPECIES: YmdB family metallophosphoesterase [unclassified Streptomyces]|uniref:YmdB family metallophosphoesterase n=1 Tax=unclassified Streptomyces TaxID=2593676 RepID=UPI001F049FF7|nr:MULTISPECIES: YmdB family metallophosphoesterase [unclassified Streptomyces]MCH0564854.1 YmdB family metallophosphoesterase [Streptomyces sp. MUM 2J]MCH0569872.1 YmdB family metallophosphoesterase [Streptomyces sp. MUM 136J]
MILLFIGDIVGDAASRYVADRLPGLRTEHNVDFVVANAENCAANGLGMGAAQVELLLASGVDVITGGNHSWDSEESVDLLALPRVVRPANVDDGVPGRGIVHVPVGDETVTVVNLADDCAMHSVKATAGKVFPAYRAWAMADRRGTTIVDYHGDHVLEKQIFAHAVDGEATAVMGTHTHEATERLRLLPRRTAFVTEVGMTGPDDGVQGFTPANLVNGLRTAGNPFAGDMPDVFDGPMVFGAVLLEIADGATTAMQRIR